MIYLSTDTPEGKIWSHKSSRKNNCDYHKKNQKYQQIYSFYIMKC